MKELCQSRGAVGAGDAIRPETAFKVDASRGFVGVHLEEFEGADCGATHALTANFLTWNNLQVLS